MATLYTVCVSLDLCDVSTHSVCVCVCVFVCMYVPMLCVCVRVRM